jgi:hypothetical protein
MNEKTKNRLLKVAEKVGLLLLGIFLPKAKFVKTEQDRKNVEDVIDILR